MSPANNANGAIYKKALADLLDIRWEMSELPVYSGYTLLDECIRRVCLWQQHLKVPKPSPLEDITALLDRSLELNKADVTLVFDRIPWSGAKRAYAQVFVNYYLKWALVEERSLTAGCQLPSPYEPWLRMYQRGQIVGSHHGDLTVNGEGLLPVHDLHPFLKRPPLLDMSDEALADIDRAAQRASSKGRLSGQTDVVRHRRRHSITLLTHRSRSLQGSPQPSLLRHSRFGA